MAWLDVYEELGPEGVSGQDIEVGEGLGTAGHDVIFVLREGIERFTITDINDPNSRSSQSDIPVMWEMPGTRDERGWVGVVSGRAYGVFGVSGRVSDDGGVH